jgi:hypothetical protein
MTGSTIGARSIAIPSKPQRGCDITTNEKARREQTNLKVVIAG